MALFQGISLPEHESLFLPGPASSQFSDDESLWDRVIRDLPDHPPPNNQQALRRNRNSGRSRRDEEDDLNSIDGSRSSRRQPPSSNFSHGTQERSRSSRSSGATRRILGELSLDDIELVPPSSGLEEPEPETDLDLAPEPEERESLSTSRRRNQTYSRRVPYVYPHARAEQPQLSQKAYNSHPLPPSSPVPDTVPETQPRTQRRSSYPSPRQTPSQRQPIWSRIPSRPVLRRDDPDDDQEYTPEPEHEPVRRPSRRIRDSQDYLDDDVDRILSEQEYNDERHRHRRLRSESVAPDWDVEMGRGDDQFDNYEFDGEGEPDLFGEDVSYRGASPTDLSAYSLPTLWSLARTSPNRLSFALSPHSATPTATLYLVPVAAATSHNAATAQTFYPSSSRRKWFRVSGSLRPAASSRTASELSECTQPLTLYRAQNRPKKRKAPTRRRRRAINPRKEPLALPKPIERITIQQLRERYRFNSAKPFPVSTQLVKAGHKAALERSRPSRRRPGVPGACGIRLPGDPRIVHPSDVPDESIEFITESTPPAATQAPRNPAERFHHSTPGRLRLQPMRGRRQAVGRQIQGVVYPQLQFTSADPPTRSTTHGSTPPSRVAAQHRTESSTPSAAVSRVPNSVRSSETGIGGGNRHRATQNASQRLPSRRSSEPLPSQVPPPTQYPNSPRNFWGADQDPPQDFEPEDRLEAHTPDPEDVPEPNDVIVVVMDNGEEVMISRSEVDNFQLTEALADLVEPTPTPPPEDIETFGDNEEPPSDPSQRTHQPLGEIPVGDPEQGLSGLQLTANLLRLAERGPQGPPPKNPRELKLEERRQRIEARRRGSESASRRESTAPSSAQGSASHSPHQQPSATSRQPSAAPSSHQASQPRSSQQRPSQRLPPNRFSQPQPTQQTPNRSQRQPTQHDGPMDLPPYPHWDDARRPGPIRNTHRSAPAESPPTLSGGQPLRRTKSTTAARELTVCRPTNAQHSSSRPGSTPRPRPSPLSPKSCRPRWPPSSPPTAPCVPVPRLHPRPRHSVPVCAAKTFTGGAAARAPPSGEAVRSFP